MLAYKLKLHTSKLNNRGMGSYVINDLSSSGQVKLATFQGEQMPFWISNYRLKLYHQPNTTEMLERMHAFTECQKMEKEQKQQAYVRLMLTSSKKNPKQILSLLKLLDYEREWVRGKMIIIAFALMFE